MHRLWISLCFAILTLLAPPPAANATTLPEDASTAVIISYTRIGEDAYSYTNLRTEQFDQQLEILTHGEYTILPLPKIIAAWKSGKTLPPQTIALTFDGAYRSAYNNAMIKLLDKNIPFTVFYAADSTPQQSNQSAHLDLKTLKTLNRNKNVTLGIHPASFSRHSSNPEEARKQIYKAITRHKDIFRQSPELFAYPFGEFSSDYKTIVKEANLTAALGLQSGAAHSGSDLFAIPRFSMTERYGSAERFTMITQALPLPAADAYPSETSLKDKQNTSVGFTTSEALIGSLSKLSCFISGQDKAALEIIGSRVEIRTAMPFSQERTRINCTMPEKRGLQTRWRWLGFLLAEEES